MAGLDLTSGSLASTLKPETKTILAAGWTGLGNHLTLNLLEGPGKDKTLFPAEP